VAGPGSDLLRGGQEVGARRSETEAPGGPYLSTSQGNGRGRRMVRSAERCGGGSTNQPFAGPISRWRVGPGGGPRRQAPLISSACGLAITRSHAVSSRHRGAWGCPPRGGPNCTAPAPRGHHSARQRSSIRLRWASRSPRLPQELIALALPSHLRRAHLSRRRIVGRAPADGCERQCGDGDG